MRRAQNGAKLGQKKPRLGEAETHRAQAQRWIGRDARKPVEAGLLLVGAKIERADRYRLVRHPGYAGSILVWGGSRLAVNWLVAAATVFVLLLVYAYRISAEEQMLVEHFGDPYRSYKARTWRLLPFVW